MRNKLLLVVDMDFVHGTCFHLLGRGDYFCKIHFCYNPAKVRGGATRRICEWADTCARKNIGRSQRITGAVEKQAAKKYENATAQATGNKQRIGGRSVILGCCMGRASVERPKCGPPPSAPIRWSPPAGVVNRLAETELRY